MPKILIGEIVRPTGIFLAWFHDFQFSGSTLIAKIPIDERNRMDKRNSIDERNRMDDKNRMNDWMNDE